MSWTHSRTSSTCSPSPFSQPDIHCLTSSIHSVTPALRPTPDALCGRRLFSPSHGARRCTRRKWPFQLPPSLVRTICVWTLRPCSHYPPPPSPRHTILSMYRRREARARRRQSCGAVYERFSVWFGFLCSAPFAVILHWSIYRFPPLHKDRILDDDWFFGSWVNKDSITSTTLSAGVGKDRKCEEGWKMRRTAVSLDFKPWMFQRGLQYCDKIFKIKRPFLQLLDFFVRHLPTARWQQN